VKTVRATSMFGFSFLTVIFEDKVDTYFARTRVLERLNSLGDLLPQGVTARLGPDATGLGWVYQYYLKDDSGTQDLGSLRTLQDTFVRYQLAAVPGVAEVASLGGFVRQYQIEVSALKLKQYGVMLGEVMDAVAASNLNIGGKTIEENGAEFVVRGVGLVRGRRPGVHRRCCRATAPRSICATSPPCAGRRRLPPRGPRRQRPGGRRRHRGDALRRERLAGHPGREGPDRHSGPRPAPGRHLESFYDRSDLIGRAIDTLKHALTEEILLVT
jgi:Cu(I)/Ag(I) efflux system membrane protein CusA/SilA